MASISNAFLSRQALSGDISRLTVTYTGLFGPKEINVFYTEDLDVFGRDNGLNGAENRIHSGPAVSFQATGAAVPRSRTFDVANSVLNEDLGEDEVYARIRITPQPIGATAQRNDITGAF